MHWIFLVFLMIPISVLGALSYCLINKNSNQKKDKKVSKKSTKSTPSSSAQAIVQQKDKKSQ
jgi:mannose/fructose/N-acetylgalactosamine-specific phosphotransferase system component IIC